MDERLKKLSSTIVNYSLEVKPNERVLINFQTEKPKIFVKYLIEDIVKVGGIPFIRMVDPMLNTVLSELTKENRIQEIKNIVKMIMKTMIHLFTLDIQQTTLKIKTLILK